MTDFIRRFCLKSYQCSVRSPFECSDITYAKHCINRCHSGSRLYFSPGEFSYSVRKVPRRLIMGVVVNNELDLLEIREGTRTSFLSRSHVH